MSSLKNNPLTHYTSPPHNYVGSAFFLSYIAVALYLTFTISYSLYTQYTSAFHSHPASPPSKFKQNGVGQVETRNARARHIKIYLGLALLSFTSISWHMLGFLITSFLDWNNGSTRNIIVALGNNAAHKLKSWMLETSLFNDFAVQLVADRESALWTQLAILATWGWNLWLAMKGTFSSAPQYNPPTSPLTPNRPPVQLVHQAYPPLYSPRPKPSYQLFHCPVHHPTPPLRTGRKPLQEREPARSKAEMVPHRLSSPPHHHP